MKAPILLRIPEKDYSDFRYQVIFRCYKWDPQVGDINTVSSDVAQLDQATAQQLAQWAEALARETVQLEEALLLHPELHNTLGLPRSLQKALRLAAGYRAKDHVRLMRFDFHPTVEGWAISEVNSDVPGGFAEASVLPELVSRFFPDARPYGNLAQSLGQALYDRLGTGKRVGFVHATSYSDDRQVMEFLGDSLQTLGLESIMLAPDHIQWNRSGEANCIADGQEGELDALVRFFPVEWLQTLPRSTDWRGFFRTKLLSCNHPAAIVTQSKRLPLVWDQLPIPVPTWKQLLPETADPRKVDWKSSGWIVKPAFGRVGENISIREVISPKEWKQIARSVRFFPKEWVAQRRFQSLPLQSATGDKHLCIGVFTVDGRAAGFYGRISSYPRIDAGAQDIAVIVSDKEEK